MQVIDIKTDFPIPSCEIRQLVWDQGTKSWQYQFEVYCDSKATLSEDNATPLHIYGHICQLKLAEKVNPTSLNFCVKTLPDFTALLKRQSEEDERFRADWISEHPDYLENVSTVVVKNETQKAPNKHVVSILVQNENETIFIVGAQ